MKQIKNLQHFLNVIIYKNINSYFCIPKDLRKKIQARIQQKFLKNEMNKQHMIMFRDI